MVTIPPDPIIELFWDMVWVPGHQRLTRAEIDEILHPQRCRCCSHAPRYRKTLQERRRRIFIGSLRSLLPTPNRNENTN